MTTPHDKPGADVSARPPLDAHPDLESALQDAAESQPKARVVAAFFRLDGGPDGASRLDVIPLGPAPQKD